MIIEATIGEGLKDEAMSMFHSMTTEEDYLPPEESCWVPYLLKFNKVLVECRMSDRGTPVHDYVLVDISNNGLFIEAYSNVDKKLMSAFFIPWKKLEIMEFKDVNENTCVFDVGYDGSGVSSEV